MNTIIKSFVDNHSKEYELNLPESEAFEHFINYIILRNYTNRHFDPGTVGTDSGLMGLDGIAIVVNDVIVASREEVEDMFAKSQKDIKVDFVFIQSKRSDKFDSGDMSVFLFSVRTFFDKQRRKASVKPKVGELMDITDYIFFNAVKLDHNPSCHMYYATTGSWNSDSNLERIISDGKAHLKALQLFGELDFIPYDENRVTSAYRDIKNSLKKTIEIDYSATVPKIENVKEAYIGLVKCKDYIGLITNGDGKLITSLFEDNVRYYQGPNAVNMEIHNTISNDDQQKPFPLLNNGVTIVAKDIRRIGNTYILSNFQIVNGCQTSFVLYERREQLRADTYMVIKLVSTEDQDLTGQIVKATNRQTPVLTEAFETLRDFHKNLELTYSTYEGEYKLFYERRSKQYESMSINKNKVVSFPVQINAFVAMFLGEPHSTHRYYGELLEANKRRMFRDDDVLQQYCLATMFLYFVEKWLRSNSPDKKVYRYHLTLLLRCLIIPKGLPRSNSKAMLTVCKTLYEELVGRDKMEEYMRKGVDILNDAEKRALESGVDRKNLPRTKELTNHIIRSIGFDQNSVVQPNNVSPLEKGQVFDCRVTGFNHSFVNVEIADHKEIGSIHIGELENRYISYIGDIVKVGDIIQAVIIDDTRHPNYGFELSKKGVAQTSG